MATPADVPFQSLSRRTVQIIAVTVIGLVVLIGVPLRALLLASYTRLEDQEARRNVDRAVSAIRDGLSVIDRACADYAVWDETRDFTQTRDDEYLTVNFAPDTFGTHGLQVVAICSTTGEVLFGRGFDLPNRAMLPLPSSLREPYTLAEGRLRRTDETDVGRAGLLVLPEGPLLVSAWPILTSERQGPSRGTLIMGRFIDEVELKRLASVTRLALLVRTPDAAAAARLGHAGAIEIDLLSDERLIGRTIIADLEGKPALLLEVPMERAIYAQGLRDLRYLLAALLVAAGAFFGVITWLLRRSVVRRVVQLSADVAEIGARQDLTARVTVSGRDELARLGNSVNALLASVETLRTQLEAERQRSERLLLDALPASIAARIKADEGTIADAFPEASVLFADIVGMTALAARTPPKQLMHMLGEIFAAFDELLVEHGLTKVKTIGAEYLVVAGVPERRADHAAALARMALDMQRAIARYNDAHEICFELRIGMHTGPVVAGVVGVRSRSYDLFGETVSLASRLEAAGVSGRIQVSRELAALLEGAFVLESRGPVEVKGRGALETYFLMGSRTEAAAV